MKTLSVPDMHCEKCVERISKALTAEGIAFSVDLGAKTVCVDENKTDLAIETLGDLGFDAKQ